MLTLPFDSASLSAWLTHLECMHPKVVDLGLERVGVVARRLDLHPSCPVVTVGGTNGKGTTVAALQTLAAHHGWRVGVYTSPHLFVFNERIVIDTPERGAQPVSDALLLHAFHAIEAARADVTLTYFEFATLAALWIFKQHALDLVILEVGMGGRLDSTNIIDADVAIITRIALDHTEYLGNTREAIAAEKAGIFRAGKPCIYGGEDLQDQILLLANQYHAQLYCFEIDFTADNAMRHAAELARIPISNLACAQTAFTLLGGVNKSHAWVSLNQKKPVGRFSQVQCGDKSVIFDVAHNPDAMALLSVQLAGMPTQDIRVIIGMLHDKDHAGSLACLLADPRISFYVSSPQTQRAAPISSLMESLRGAKATGYDSLEAAWEASSLHSRKDTLWVVTGSFYTVAQVWEHVCERQRILPIT